MNRISVVLLACLALALSACGGGGTEKNAQGLREVKIGMLPILPTAALHAGIEQGFFEDHGIELEIETGQGGAALLPAIVSQNLQFATSNPVSLLTARDKGLDVRVVSHWTSILDEGKDVNGVVAKSDSGIKSAKDLEGKTVAINTLKSMGDLTIREAVRKDGGDPDAVKFAELGFPDMPGALDKGNVDAVWVPEPFLTILTSGGAHLVGYTSRAAVPGMTTQYVFTSGTLIEKDPELVDDMTAALEETLTYAEENPDAVRAAVPKVIPDLDPKLLDKVRIEAFGTDLRTDQLRRIGELMKDDGMISKDPDIEGLLP